MLRPARASSMRRRRYSGAYGGCVRGIGNLLFYFSQYRPPKRVNSNPSAEPFGQGRFVSGFSFRRFTAVLRKEWVRIRRDPFTLRMIIALPVMQLFLFGYAINADPKHLPTGLLSADHFKYERTLVGREQPSRQ